MVTKTELKELEKEYNGAVKAFEATKEQLAKKENKEYKMGGKTLVRPNKKLLDTKKQYNGALKAINNSYNDIADQIYIIEKGVVVTDNEEKDILIKFFFEVEEVDYTLNQIFFYFMNLAKLAKKEEAKNKAFERLEKAKKELREEKEAKQKAKAER